MATLITIALVPQLWLFMQFDYYSLKRGSSSAKARHKIGDIKS